MKAFFFAAAVFALAVCAGMYVTRPRETASVLPLDLTQAASVQADVSDAQIPAPEEQEAAPDDAVVPVIVKLRRAYDSGREPVRALPVLTVRLKDGKVYLNDTPVPPDDLEILRAACGSAAH